jgi:D-alanine-D-alanine ligase
VFDGAGPLYAAIAEQKIDRVFNLMHGPGGEDGAIQGAMQLMDIPVTGSGVLGSALSMDKVRSKWVWERLGIRTAPFMVFVPGSNRVEEVLARFDPPLFVKPAGLGSSIGISKVMSPAELTPAIDLAAQYSSSVVVERAIAGSEYFAGILGRTVLPLIRVETPNAFYDYEAKYESDETCYYCPSGLESELEQRLKAESLKAFDALDASGWGRVDFILDEELQPCFLEVNTAPGMTDHSLVPQAAEAVGVGFDELVWRVLETSL